MTATPPTRSRANTPPTPLHGPKFDTYEPYSPRRSTRQANKGNVLSSTSGFTSQAGVTKNVNRKVTQGLQGKHARQTTLSQVLSPPSSPATPQTSQRRESHELFDLNPNSKIETDDSDADMLERLPTTRHGDTTFPNMLPTPMKTPRKRDLKYESKLSATARVLFPGRAMSPEDRMPTHRKSRRSKKHIAFSLDSPPAGNSISIFTDSKDRVPDVEESEENPFIVQRIRQPRASRSATNKRTKHGMNDEIDRAVENGEGMVYTFRGKKIYRKFSDAADEYGASEDPEHQTLLHHAGEAAQRPLTRSAMKPRLLFPPKAPSPEPSQSDEEALTDIEHGVVPETETDGEDDYETSDPQEDGYYGRTKSGEWISNDVKRVAANKMRRCMIASTPPRNRSPSPGPGVTTLASSGGFDRASTPVRQQIRLATPPTTIRKNKPRGKKSIGDLSPLDPEVEFLPLPAVRRMNNRPASPFDEWYRTKPNTRSLSATKRPGEPMLATEAKRTRSGGAHGVDDDL